MRKKTPRPPRFVEWILRFVANKGERSAIVGDFIEEFQESAEKEGIRQAKRWYIRLALRSVPSFLKSHFYWSGQMFHNFLKIFIRNIQNHKAYSFINIAGLATAIAASFMIFLFVSFEFSYDGFHQNADRLYRIRNDRIYTDIRDKSAGCPPALGPALEKEFPEILASARVVSVSDRNNIVTYVSDRDYIQNVLFSLKGYDQAKKIAVIGRFNGWNPERHFLERKGNLWQSRILFPPGRYSYRFVVDGKEICDPDNPDRTTYRSESYSVLTVKEPGIIPNRLTHLEPKIFYADPSFLRIFSFPMKQGSRESALENPNTAVISESTAQKYFNEKNPVGQMMVIANQNGKQLCQITGVFQDVPENTHIKFDFLLSYQTLIQLRPNASYDWGWNMFNTYVMLASGTDPGLLQDKFQSFMERHKMHGKDYRRELILQPIKDIHLHSHLRWEPEINGSAKTVYFLTIIAVFILLIAWINYINLSTARSITRAKEVGIRKVLGSRRFQLIEQFISESVLINLFALMFALLFIRIFLPSFIQLVGKPLSLSWTNAGIAWFWMTLSVLTGTFLSALYPALVLSSFSPNSVLRGKFLRTHRGIGFRKIMVIFQFALSVILIIGTLIVSKQLRYMQNSELGIQIDQTVVVRIPGNMAYSSERVERFKREVKNSPHIKAVAASSSVPGKEYSNASSGIRPLASNPEDGKRCFFISVDYDYFRFYGNEIMAGRKFSEEFPTDLDAAILNEEAARLFGYETPEQTVGQKILLGGLGGGIRETIGVVKDYHHKSLKVSFQPIMFTLTEGDPNGRHNFFSIKTVPQDIARAISFIQKAWDKVYAGTPFDYFFLDQSFHNLYQSDRQFGRVFSLFALLSVLISCLGLFGLAAFLAQQRTKEIGIRRVLGATSFGIVFLISREFVKWVLASNLIAWPIAYYAMTRWLQNFAFRTHLGMGVFFLAMFLSLIIAILTVIYQSIRTARANPADTLRYE
jgi:putative ABC transport system permease protein